MERAPGANEPSGEEEFASGPGETFRIVAGHRELWVHREVLVAKARDTSMYDYDRTGTVVPEDLGEVFDRFMVWIYGREISLTVAQAVKFIALLDELKLYYP